MMVVGIRKGVVNNKIFTYNPIAQPFGVLLAYMYPH